MNPARGLLLHDGVARRGARLLLVGERVGPPAGVVLESSDGGATLKPTASFSQALHLRAVTVDTAGVVFVAGDTSAGKGLLLRLRRLGATWERVRIPAGVTELDGVTVVAGTLVAAGEAGDRGIVLVSTDDGVTWRNAVRLEPTGRRFARLNALAVHGSRIAAVGDDGVHAAVFVSRDGGTRFERLRPPPALVRATAAAFATREDLYVGGSRGGGGAGAGGAILARRHEGSWSTVRVPPSASLTALIFLSPRRGFAAQATGRADAVLVTADGGRSWRSLRITPPVAPTLERLFAAPGGPVYAVGVGGVFRLGGR
jgi:photosystem II stability/assembly factor-like uncharacterized protein